MRGQSTDELRAEILSILKGFGVSGGMFEQRTENIMQLITSYTDKKVREARMEEAIYLDQVLGDEFDPNCEALTESYKGQIIIGHRIEQLNESEEQPNDQL